MSKVLVLSVRRFNFTSEKSGELIRGITVEYIDPGSELVGAGDRRGLPAFSIGGDLSLDGSFTAVPGVYEIDLRMRPGLKGRPTLQLSGATLVKGVKSAEILNGFGNKS